MGFRFLSFGPEDSSELQGSFTRAHGPEGWYVAGNRTPTSPGYLMFFSVPAADSSESPAPTPADSVMSLSPDGRSLLYAKFVSTGANLMLLENFQVTTADIIGLPSADLGQQRVVIALQREDTHGSFSASSLTLSLIVSPLTRPTYRLARPCVRRHVAVRRAQGCTSLSCRTVPARPKTIG